MSTTLLMITEKAFLAAPEGVRRYLDDFARRVVFAGVPARAVSMHVISPESSTRDGWPRGRGFGPGHSLELRSYGTGLPEGTGVSDYLETLGDEVLRVHVPSYSCPCSYAD